MLRVIEILTNDFGAHNYGTPSQKDESVKWEGESAEQLSRTYPPSPVMFADPLGHSEIEDGLIRYDYRYEQLSDGEWVVIDDPRVRLNPGMTAAEREQDAENRRRFPGDFATEDDEDEDDYYETDSNFGRVGEPEEPDDDDINEIGPRWKLPSR